MQCVSKRKDYFVANYWQKRFSETNFRLVAGECRDAVRKGLFSYGAYEKELLEKVRKLYEVSVFVEERGKAISDYNTFCRRLEKRLPHVSSIKNLQQRLGQLFPLFRKALIFDTRRRVFDSIFNYPKNILDFHLRSLEKILNKSLKQKNAEKRKETAQKLIYSVLDSFSQPSFASEEIRDILSLFLTLRENNVKRLPLSTSELEFIFKHITFRDRIKSQKFLNKYFHGSFENALESLQLYEDSWGNEMGILEKIDKQQHEKKIKRKRLIKRVACLISERRLKEVKLLISKIDLLLRINCYEDPKEHRAFNGIQDYFLRKELVTCLQKLGAIKSLNPTSFNQLFLLKKAEGFLRNEYQSKRD